MANITSPDKTTGQDHFAVEYQEFKDWMNSPSKSLGAFNPEMTFDSQGQYNDYTLASDIILTASSVVPFNMRVVRISIPANNTHNITFGSGIDKVITQFINPLPEGNYWFYMGSFVSPGGGGFGVHVSIPDIQAVSLVTPVLQTAVVENATDTILDLGFNTPMSITTAGWSIASDGAGISISSLSSGDDTVSPKFQLSRSVVPGETLTVSYNSGTGATQTTAQAVPLANITNQSVTNNVIANPPVFSNVSVDQLELTQGNFNAQIDKAGTIYWAVYPTADPQRTKAEIAAGTGAVDFGNTPTPGSTIAVDTFTGLAAETAYKVHYYAEDSGSIETNAAMTSEFTMGFSELFTGTTIDTGTWTITNPTTSITFSQNNELIIEGDGTASVGVGPDFASTEGKKELSYGGAGTLQINARSIQGTTQNAGIIARLIWDDTGGLNILQIAKENVPTNARWNYGSWQSGTSDIGAMTGTDIDTATDFRLSFDGTTAKIDEWTGAAWSNLYTTSISASQWVSAAHVVLFGSNGSDGGQTKSHRFDNMYLVQRTDYTTQYPQ